MVTLFYILVFLAIWHFFYESVIAPALRHGLRYEFFSLRDELRALKINGLKGKTDNVVYEILDHTMCDIIDSMSFISIANYLLLKKDFAENKQYKEDAERVSELMNNVKNKRLIEIDGQLRKLSSKALLINNGGLSLYLVPFAVFIIILILVSSQLHRILTEINKISTRLVYGSQKLNYIPNAVKVSNNF